MVPSLKQANSKDRRPTFQISKRLFGNFEWLTANLEGQIKIAEDDSAHKLTEEDNLIKLLKGYSGTITNKHPNLNHQQDHPFQFLTDLKVVQCIAGNYIKVDTSFPESYTQLQQDLVFAELGILAHQTQQYKVTVKLSSH
ncbi:unnamed protein product [Ambrosiozyma monospora]|uniref:Unnamed protein product n=1 Tax=Ambrosiozyma monospora TaxID=43982 RepID=A0ACB5STB6_AMBMO|nr:unnamed protein product [Ambrosiozyma monospora]